MRKQKKWTLELGGGGAGKSNGIREEAGGWGGCRFSADPLEDLCSWR